MRKRILFYATEVAHFWDSMKPLFYKYLEKGAFCTVVFPKVEKMQEVGRGVRNVERMYSIKKEIDLSGAEYYFRDEWDKNQEHYDVCFVASDYTSIDSTIKKRCKYMVALQITAIYTHIYIGVSNCELVFNIDCIDYFVTSQFVVDWVCEKMVISKEKFLAFGYPRLDDLYQRLHQQDSVSLTEWGKIINGKKVFFVVGTHDFPYWLSCIKNGIIIYRPHPFNLEDEKENGILNKIEKFGNVIIDSNETYYDAFTVADALISSVLCSLAENFLMTDKPVLLLDDEKFDMRRRQHVKGYREEAWYKSSYIAKHETDIENFAEMVCQGKDLLNKEHEPYRKYMQQHFDGNVCNRVIEYFDTMPY